MNPNGQRKEADRQWLQLKKALGLKPQSSSGDLVLSVAQTRLLADAKYAKRTMEVGCAGGELTLALALRGQAIYGIDPSPKAIQHCQNHCDGQFRDRYVQIDTEQISDFPGISGKFDCVIMCGFLDYQEDPDAVMRAAWKMVDENGQLLIACGKHRFWKGHMANLAGAIGSDWRQWPYLVEEDEHYIYLTVRKTAQDTRYLFVTSREIQAEQANECVWDKRFKNGIWTWARAFQGDVQYMEAIENVEDYDVIHVQLSGEMLDYPRRLKDMMKDGQKLVVNPDYSLDLWGMFMRYPDMLWHQMSLADAVFAQDPYAANFVGHMLNRPCPTIPHPVNIAYIERSIVPCEKRQDAMVIAHQDLRGHLGFYHYDGTDLRVHYSGPNPQASGQTVSLYDQLFDVCHEYISGGEMLDLMASKKICSDTYSYTTTGRVSTELAALGVPSIGYTNLNAQVHCFPQTTFAELDLVGIRECVKRLLDDILFYEEVSAYARKAVQHYGLEVSKQRFLTMLEDADVSRRDDPRLGVPEGTEAHRQEAGCEVGHEMSEMDDSERNGSAGESLQLRSACDEDSERERELSPTGQPNLEIATPV